MKVGLLKFWAFLKKNVAYFVLAFCVLAVGVSIAYAVIKENSTTVPVAEVVPSDELPTDISEEVDPSPVVVVEDPEPVAEIITFISPVESPVSVEDFSDTLVFNSTLKRYEAHKAVDFYAEEGTKVFAVYDGKVESVENGLLTGITITIDHGNGLKTIYNSLADGDSVSVGQEVKKGDVIGEISVSNRQEYKSGAHLHFEVKEFGESVNPAKYLSLGDK